VYFSDDIGQSDNFGVLFEDFCGFLMFYAFDFDEKEHIEGMPDVFGPMIVEFEEDFAHDEHGDLVFAVLVEEFEEIIEDNQNAIDGCIVISFEDDLADLEEIVLVEGCRELHGLFFGHHLHVLVDQLKSDLHFLGLVGVDLVADER
jgi:hypothetical protein